ncbi:hypothetical protein [Anabaena lutea]|uniref:Uncharacterized protein n=1 Tax=Anabaena lutea FACHB-196 TaxID=2692881 RepID=A0ABR8FNJ5_9NOST|nr:hypothetical protein [Anabaena lutea]MBD2570445.1 hypothetical protein [Anabaena lutea FACHB-196]
MEQSAANLADSLEQKEGAPQGKEIPEAKKVKEAEDAGKAASGGKDIDDPIDKTEDDS